MPDSIRTTKPLDLPPALSEVEALRRLRELAARNRPLVPMIGLGYSGTITPGVIRRNVLEDPSWYTAYTPYQPEISQGRLEALLNFQTMVSDLTGLPTANASLLDEGTAAAEAMTLVRRANRKNTSTRFIVDADCLPQTIAVMQTRAAAMGLVAEVRDLSEGLPDDDFCGVLVQYPGTSGRVVDPRPLIEAAHEAGALAVVAADLLALTILESPGAMGADVVLGSSQRFGVPLFYGGPHAGFMSVAAGLERHLPGRLVGVSVDTRRAPGVPTRAADPRAAHPSRQGDLQHLHGSGAAGRGRVDVRRLPRTEGPAPDRRAHPPVRRRTGRGTCARRGTTSSMSSSSTRSPSRCLGGPRRSGRPRTTLACTSASTAPTGSGSHCRRSRPASTCRRCSRRSGSSRPTSTHWMPPAAIGARPALLRQTDYLTHPVFNSHRSETQLLRYLKLLSDRDYALDRGMIPLGSCTMKLNATAEMEPISLPGFADLHPFAPVEDALGYAQLVEELEGWLAEVTGYAQVSIQPNAGSQGELAGLLAIRGYHHANGQTSATSA